MTTKSLSSSNGLTRPITLTATTRLPASTVSQPAVMPTTCHVICWPPYMASKRSIMTKYGVQSIRRSVTWHHVTSRAQMQPSVTPMSVLYMQHAASHGSSLTHTRDSNAEENRNGIAVRSTNETTPNFLSFNSPLPAPRGRWTAEGEGARRQTLSLHRGISFNVFVCSLFCQRFLDNPRADSSQILHAGVLWFRMCLLPFWVWGLAAPGWWKKGEMKCSLLYWSQWRMNGW